MYGRENVLCFFFVYIMSMQFLTTKDTSRYVSDVNVVRVCKIMVKNFSSKNEAVCVSTTTYESIVRTRLAFLHKYVSIILVVSIKAMKLPIVHNLQHMINAVNYRQLLSNTQIIVFRGENPLIDF